MHELPSKADETGAEEVDGATPFQRRYALVLMALVSASQMADRQLLSIVMEPVKREFGLSDTQLGFLNGTVFGTAYAIGAVPFAILADRWSRKKIIATTLAFWSVMTALTAAAASYTMMVVVRALVGVGEAGAGPAMLALLSRKFAPEKRSGMVALITVMSSLSAFAAFWAAGAITERFGWRALFLIFGLPGLALAFVIWTTLEDLSAATRQPARFMAADVRDVLMRAPMLHLFAAAGWCGVISAGTQGWMSSYLIRTFEMSFSDVGFWLGVSAAMAGVVGALAGGFLTNALTARIPTSGMWLCLIVVTLYLPLSLSVYIAHSQPVALALLLVSNVTIGMSGPPIASQLLNFMPDRVRSTVMAICSMGILFVAGLGPALAGTLSDWLTGRGDASGLRSALMIIACLGVLPILHFAAILARPPRPADAAAA